MTPVACPLATSTGEVADTNRAATSYRTASGVPVTAVITSVACLTRLSDQVRRDNGHSGRGPEQERSQGAKVLDAQECSRHRKKQQHQQQEASTQKVLPHSLAHLF